MSDQYHYDRPTLEALLPACWDDEFGILASRAEQEIRSKGDPAHGGGLMAMVADVRRAWDTLDRLDHDVLRAKYLYGLGFSAIADLGGYESEQEAADDLDRVVNQMIEYLGG
jgi:hypothetical protein